MLLSKAVCNLLDCLRKETHARMLEANKQFYDSFLTTNSGNHREEFHFTTLDQTSRIDWVSIEALEPEQRVLLYIIANGGCQEWCRWEETERETVTETERETELENALIDGLDSHIRELVFVFLRFCHLGKHYTPQMHPFFCNVVYLSVDRYWFHFFASMNTAPINM